MSEIQVMVALVHTGLTEHAALVKENELTFEVGKTNQRPLLSGAFHPPKGAPENYDTQPVYYVYTHTVDGNVLTVGKGRGDRAYSISGRRYPDNYFIRRPKERAPKVSAQEVARSRAARAAKKEARRVENEKKAEARRIEDIAKAEVKKELDAVYHELSRVSGMRPDDGINYIWLYKLRNDLEKANKKKVGSFYDFAHMTRDLRRGALDAQVREWMTPGLRRITPETVNKTDIRRGD